MLDVVVATLVVVDDGIEVDVDDDDVVVLEADVVVSGCVVDVVLADEVDPVPDPDVTDVGFVVVGTLDDVTIAEVSVVELNDDRATVV